ncbi:aspartate kinase [Amycolatopsis sp. PS_44_ISF1]|uniref:aspartate kinase n=1 Tax=Amycolatopsis sp. PS_44_ISF1 TaxID=2974917 RepID=UPI0028DF170F|nr:aspartate kinase [Amycolatopsis sp. PS_44_ISF1]MDT8913872.1 aspartate kinase [Amycolatopsis sp. PS_44_ISF1]
MTLIVQKYGGSSVATPDRLAAVAARIAAARRAGSRVAVVVSAMGRTTDELLALAGEVGETPSPRELDHLLSAGEQISSALLTMALHRIGVQACSLSGRQAGLRTTAAHGGARILDIDPARVHRELDQGRIVVVAGFQGVRPDTSDTTTLGRGGSDTTAVALAAALGARRCEIYTDVDGVYTADPRLVPDARRIPALGHPAMLELATAGAKVLVARCVECAHRHGVRLHVRSSYTDHPGTLVSADPEDIMEQPAITGVAHDRSVAAVTLTGVPSGPATTALVLRAVAVTGVEVDMLTRTPALAGSSTVEVTVVVPEPGLPRVLAALEARRPEIGFTRLAHDESAGKVSVIGTGVRSDPTVTARFLETLAGAGLRQLVVSELRLSALCDRARLDEAVRALHRAFDLHEPPRLVLPASRRAGAQV